MTALHVRRWINELRLLHREAGLVRDAQLVDDLQRGDTETAFRALLQRHGSLVFNVCRRVLGHDHDAEDAFQATFLVLARRAKSIRKVASLAAWLHGVAFRVATKMKADAYRRQQREHRAATHAEPAMPVDISVRELGVIVHAELARLPESQRQALVLCYLEGLSQEEAAQRLGWPRGTLKRRLERGRDRLRKVLVRRGLALGIPILAGLLADAACAAVPAPLKDLTIKSSILACAGKEIPSSLASRQVLSIIQGELRSMIISKLRIIVVGLACLTFVGTGIGVWLQAASPKGDAIEAVDHERGPVLAAPVPENDSKSSGSAKESKELTDAELLIGTWRIVRMESSGAADKKAMEHVKFTFDGKDMKWHTEQGGFDVGYTIDTTKTPHEIDLNGGGGGRMPPMSGIYKFDGKKLLLAISPFGRPDSFVTTAKTTFIVYELERVEKKEGQASPETSSK